MKPEISKEFINLEKLFQDKNPKLYRLIPTFVFKYLRRVIHQDEINANLYEFRDLHGIDFIKAVLNRFGVIIHSKDLKNLPATGRYIIVSNHPLGGADGVALGSIIGQHYDGNFRYLINDLLMNLPGIRPVSIGINKTGSQSRNFPQMVEAGFQSDNHMLMFPAGICSRKINGKIHDLAWTKTFVSKSVQYKRDVVPIHFGGQNSDKFYRIANICKALHLKFNIAMLFLVDEMYKNVHKTFRVSIGKPIPWQTFDKSKTSREWARIVEEEVYKL